MSELEHQEPGLEGAGGDTPKPAEPPSPQQAEQPPAPPAPSGPRIAYNDRVLVLGMTQSGKSELHNHLFSAIRTQRVLIDHKDEFSIAGVEPVRNVAAIDWRDPVIHYVPRRGDPGEYEELFKVLNRRKHLVVAVHELGALCRFHPGATPPAVWTYITQGAAHGRGLLGASQRPVSFPSAAGTEAEHVFIFVPRFTGKDLRTAADFIGYDWRELGNALDATHRSFGDYSYLYFDRATRHLRPGPPLPDHLRRHTIVSRRTVA